MTVSAHDVAAVLRERLPGLPTKKLHKLLYYCQGHHLAAFDEPLFTDTISAWDMGPVVGTLWFMEKNDRPAPPRRDLTEGELNTVGYVLSRYGSLTGMDLERLTHSEAPWREADLRRPQGETARIDISAIRTWFQSDAVGEDTEGVEAVLDTDAVHAWLQDAHRRQDESRRPDDREALRARFAGRA